jgi:hypothetical protein
VIAQNGTIIKTNVDMIVGFNWLAGSNNPHRAGHAKVGEHKTIGMMQDNVFCPTLDAQELPTDQSARQVSRHRPT